MKRSRSARNVSYRLICCDEEQIQIRVFVSLVFCIRATQKRGDNPLICLTSTYESF